MVDSSEIKPRVTEISQENLNFAFTEGIKLIKNSKGYNWEIKVNNLDIEALEKLNAVMIQKFGGLDE